MLFVTKKLLFSLNTIWNTSFRYTYNANQENLCTPYNFKASHNLLKVTKLTSANFLFQNTQQYFLQSFRLCHLGLPMLFRSENRFQSPPTPPRLKLNSKCFSARPLSPIFVTVFWKYMPLHFPSSFLSNTLSHSMLAWPSPGTIPYTRCFLSPQHCSRCRHADWAHH